MYKRQPEDGVAKVGEVLAVIGEAGAAEYEAEAPDEDDVQTCLLYTSRCV